jgi:hypothetical protein
VSSSVITQYAVASAAGEVVSPWWEDTRMGTSENPVVTAFAHAEQWRKANHLWDDSYRLVSRQVIVFSDLKAVSS